MKPMQKCRIEAGSKSKSIPMDTHVKMVNFTAEINMFTAWYRKKKQFSQTTHVLKCLLQWQNIARVWHLDSDLISPCRLRFHRDAEE